jgi:hypothetical protein
MKSCVYGNGLKGDLLRLSVAALANWSGFVILKYCAALPWVV